MSLVGRRENNQEKQHYRGNKLQFLSYEHGALLPMIGVDITGSSGSSLLLVTRD